MPELQLTYALAGLIIGALIGLTGMGGGAFMTPLLILLGVPPVKAVGTDMVYAAVTKIFGSLKHKQQKTIHWTLVKYFALGSVPASLVGVFGIALLESRGFNVNSLLTSLLGVTLIVTAVLLLGRTLLGLDKGDKHRLPAALRRKGWTVFAGAVGGLLVGMTSVGSGTLFIALMILLYKLPAKLMVGTDIAHATILLLVAGAAQASVGHVDWSLALNLMLGSIPGVLIGSHANFKAPEGVVRPVLAVVLLVAGVRLV